MSLRPRTLSLVFVGAVGAAAVAYGCSDDPLAAPGELDAGNPTRVIDSGRTGGGDAAPDAPPTVSYKARATLAATGLADAGNVMGTVDFTETNGTVAIEISVTGATPGDHGMHIHAGTSCDTNDAGAAGAALGHWNPGDAGHGLPGSGATHAGDLGNVTIGDGGAGTKTMNATGFNVQPDGGDLSALGHAVIFHQGTDDGSQPAGNAGGRAGCGVIVAQ